ncbi:choline dehydrogenase [Endogone sp. FLAS-F59071]|nr:choline dehydrogenase [Endogone sp. FLAS-F59071]|eukprot:RUS21799.1 choline dehydrogenase [Endogone sp. FLAS-F59071]
MHDIARKSKPEVESYDFIIVGAGTAGCVLARELIEKLKQVRILVLEAGPCDAQLNDKIHAPFDAGVLWGSSGCDWGYATEPQTMNSTVNPTRTIANPAFAFPRGKVWGGSSSTNAMIYI